MPLNIAFTREVATEYLVFKREVATEYLVFRKEVATEYSLKERGCYRISSF